MQCSKIGFEFDNETSKKKVFNEMWWMVREKIEIC